MMEEIKRNDLKNLKFLKKDKIDNKVLSQIRSELESDARSQTGFTTTTSDIGFQISNTI